MLTWETLHLLNISQVALSLRANKHVTTVVYLRPRVYSSVAVDNLLLHEHSENVKYYEHSWL